MILEFQRADRMRDALDRVGLAVREIVHRVDAPCSPVRGWWACRIRYSTGSRRLILRRRHVDLGAQHPGAVRELARPHAAEQVEIFVDDAVAERAVPAGLGQRAAVVADLVRRLVVDVGLAGPDEMHGPFVELLEVVGGVDRGARPSRSRASARRRWMASMYSCSSLTGLVSSKRRWQRPAELLRDAEIQAIDLAWPMCR